MYQILNSYDTVNPLFPPQSADAKSFDRELFTLKSSFWATFWPALRQMFSWERRIPGAQWEIRSWCGIFFHSIAACLQLLASEFQHALGHSQETPLQGWSPAPWFFSKCIVTVRETQRLRSSFSLLCSPSVGNGVTQEIKTPNPVAYWFFVYSAAAAIGTLRVRWDVQEESAFQMLSTWFQVIDLKPLHLSSLLL